VAGVSVPAVMRRLCSRRAAGTVRLECLYSAFERPHRPVWRAVVPV